MVAGPRVTSDEAVNNVKIRVKYFWTKDRNIFVLQSSDHAADVRQQEVGEEAECAQGGCEGWRGAGGAGEEGGDVHVGAGEAQQAPAAVPREAAGRHRSLHPASGEQTPAIHYTFCFDLAWTGSLLADSNNAQPSCCP